MSYQTVPLGDREVVGVWMPNNSNKRQMKYQAYPRELLSQIQLINDAGPDAFTRSRLLGEENVKGAIARFAEILKTSLEDIAEVGGQVEENIALAMTYWEEVGLGYFASQKGGPIPEITIRPHWSLKAFTTVDNPLNEPTPGSREAITAPQDMLAFYDKNTNSIILDGQVRWDESPIEELDTRRIRPSKETTAVTSLYIQSLLYKLKPAWFESDHAETRSAVVAVSNSIAMLSLLMEEEVVKLLVHQAVQAGLSGVDSQTPVDEQAEFVARKALGGHSPLAQIHDKHTRGSLAELGLAGDVMAQASLFTGAMHEFFIQITSRDEKKHGRKHRPYERYQSAAEELMVALVQAVTFADNNKTSFEELIGNVFLYINPQYRKPADMSSFVMPFLQRGIVPANITGLEELRHSDDLELIQPTRNDSPVNQALLPQHGMLTLSPGLIDSLMREKQQQSPIARTALVAKVAADEESVIAPQIAVDNPVWWKAVGNWLHQAYLSIKTLWHGLMELLFGDWQTKQPSKQQPNEAAEGGNQDHAPLVFDREAVLADRKPLLTAEAVAKRQDNSAQHNSAAAPKAKAS